jgi:Ni,Fe-hydrogenase I large subunit
MANRANGTYEVDPISRIEGHLGVRITISGGTVSDASAHGNLWRGFENFLLGRDPNDAITFTQRICGVCPVPHGQTSTYAIDSVLGYSKNHITFATNALPSDGFGIPKKAVLIRNLVLAAEFLMSSITHFYHLAAPSYVQGPAIPPWTPYFNNSYYHTALRANYDFRTSTARTALILPKVGADGYFSYDVWSTVIRSYVKALRIRRLTFEAGALFAGRMPMTSTFIGGGVTFGGTESLTDRCNKFTELTKEIGLFIVQEYVPIALVLGRLYSDGDNPNNGGSSISLGTNKGVGGGLGRYLAWGAFPNIDASGTLSLPGGLKDIGTPASDFQVWNKQEVYDKYLAGGTKAVPDNLTEDIENSRYQIDTKDSAAYGATGHPYTNGHANAAYPGDVSRTHPQRTNGYTYMKAPRWAGKSCEVGPLARLMVAGLYVAGANFYVPSGGNALQQMYRTYTKTTAGHAILGLDPKMIEPDIAVALVRCGLATLRLDPSATGTVTDVTSANIDTFDTATIVAAYTGASAFGEPVITGTVLTWISTLVMGYSTMDRLRARALESLYLVQEMIGAYDKATNTWGHTTLITGHSGWVGQLAALSNTAGSTWRDLGAIPLSKKQGWGATEAPRGALMHQAEINAGKITKYQCIVPTTWNGSPSTSADGGYKGAIESACLSAPVADYDSTFTSQNGSTTIHSQGGVEILRVAQSFDPCIACAIH